MNQPPQWGPHQGQWSGQAAYPRPPKKGGVPVVVWILLVVLGVPFLMFAGCVVCVAVAKTSPTAATAATTRAATTETTTTPAMHSAAPEPTSEEIEALQLSATKLFADYHANEVTADDDYKGKNLLVTGTLAKIRKDFADDIVLDLATSNRFEPVDANVRKSEKGKVSKLSTGDSVTILCVGGGMVIGRPHLRDCRIFDGAAK